MKKMMLILGMLAAGIAANAQQTVSIGPTAGIGHAFMYPYDNWELKPSWNAGLTAIYGPVEWWGVGLDVRYSQEGYKRMVEGTEHEMTLDYLRVPIKGIIFFGDYEDDFRPKVSLGPSLGFLLDQESTHGWKANDFDLGVLASAGFNYRIVPRIWLNTDLNYYQGLLDVRQHSGTTELNGNLGLTVGVAFGLSKIADAATNEK